MEKTTGETGEITLSAKEQRRIEVLTRLAAGTLDRAQAQELLACSGRTLRRLQQRLQEHGVAALAHGNRGRAPAHKTAAALAQRVRELAGEGGPYHGLNACHLQEILAEREGLTLGRSTLDRLLKAQGLRQARKGHKRRVFRQRARMAAAGMLVQIDASPHDWLEGRGPRMALLGAIDDATGSVLYLRFHPTEDQAGYLRLLRTVTVEHGLPLAFYHDRHTILRSPKGATLEDELAGQEPRSQVQRVMHLLGVESIPARTPQAKGRVERLWGTLQDRLVQELRLAGVTTLAGANAFLPAFLARFNGRFAQAASDPEPAWVSVEAGLDLAYYFSTCEARQVRADQTLSYLGQTLRIEGATNYRGRKVSVHQAPEGELYLYDGKERLTFRPVASRPPKAAPDPPAPQPAKAPAPEAAARRRAWLHGQPA